MNKFSKYIAHFILPLITMILFFVVLFQISSFRFITHAQTSGSVTFGAIGDMGGSSNASAVLNGVKNANLNFFLHVGDFSYDQQGGPTGWPTWVKGIVGTVLPYEIVSGNHDDCCIASYVAGLPNKMANMNGTYGQNYYFDYPQTSPLMRVIMISPGGFTVDTTWLTTAIDAARNANIPWVIVGMHRNCITTGQKSCEIGQSLTDLLLSKKVDLILQGHDHNYQRTKQLTCAKANTYNAACVVNAGPTYTKGAGTVIVLNGAGGNGFYSVNAADSEAGYFAKINSDTYGFSQFTVTANQITEQFVRTGGGSMSDSFSINNSGIPIPSNTNTPLPTATLVPTQKPLPSPTPSIKPSATVVPNPSVISTRLTINVLLHGIGNGGDTANPLGQGNSNPMHPTRNATIEIYDIQNQLALTTQGILIFTPSTGSFTGTFDLGPTFASGVYTIKLKTEQYLRLLFPGILTLTQGIDNNISAKPSLTTGDINNDNSVSILDYNILIGCYADLLPAVSCTNQSKISADITDDGNVNQYDYNLFIRELNNRPGQ